MHVQRWWPGSSMLLRCPFWQWACCCSRSVPLSGREAFPLPVLRVFFRWTRSSSWLCWLRGISVPKIRTFAKILKVKTLWNCIFLERIYHVASRGYAGAPFEQWVKEHLGIRLEAVNHPWTGLRGVWAQERTVIDWDKILPKGFHIFPRRWVVERMPGSRT